MHSASATEPQSTELRSLIEIAAEALRANPGWLDEAVDETEASRVTCEAVASLRSKRTRGGGPVFGKRGAKVYYVRRDLFEYLAAGRRTSTSDVGQAVA
jgi:hypothetical protein